MLNSKDMKTNEIWGEMIVIGNRLSWNMSTKLRQLVFQRQHL